MKTSSSAVTSVDRALNILEMVGKTNRPLSVRDIFSELEIPAASCFRIVKNLVSRGYLMESYDAVGQYVLGFSLINLSEQALQRLDVRAIAIPYMKEISIETRQAVQLGILKSYEVVYIEQELPLYSVDVIAPLNEPLPVNLSAAGKILCAFLPIYQQKEYLGKAVFPKNTEKTIVDKEEFQTVLHRVHEQQYALDLEEYSLGIGCIAVPIFDFQNRCVASLGVTGDISYYNNPQKLNMCLKVLQKASREISRRLGFQQVKSPKEDF